LKSISANNVSGSSLTLIVQGKNSWQDETYNVTNVLVEATSQAQPRITDQYEFLLYPNPPTGNSFILDLADLDQKLATIRVFDNMGRAVHTMEGNGVMELPTSIFPSAGIYFFNIQVDGYSKTIKYLVQQSN